MFPEKLFFKNSSFWHFNSCFVSEENKNTSKHCFHYWDYLMNFWRNNWRSIFDVVERLCYFHLYISCHLAVTKFKLMPLPLCSFLISRNCKEVKKWTKRKRHKNESFSSELISTQICLNMSNTYFQILVPKLGVASLWFWRQISNICIPPMKTPQPVLP